MWRGGRVKGVSRQMFHMAYELFKANKRWIFPNSCLPFFSVLVWLKKSPPASHLGRASHTMGPVLPSLPLCFCVVARPAGHKAEKILSAGTLAGPVEAFFCQLPKEDGHRRASRFPFPKGGIPGKGLRKAQMQKTGRQGHRPIRIFFGALLCPII